MQQETLKSDGSDGHAHVPEAPERLCAVTRRHDEPDRLIRFVAAPDGRIVPDLALKLPGRGVWLTPTRAVVLQAVRQKAFARSLKREVTAEAALADQVGDLMLTRVSAYLALANKAGLALAGFTKVDRALERGTVYLLLHAADGAADGIRKLDQKFSHVVREMGEDRGKTEPGWATAEQERRTVRFLTSEELSLALGRTNVVHAGMLVGGTSKAFLREAERLLRYRLGTATNSVA